MILDLFVLCVASQKMNVVSPQLHRVVGFGTVLKGTRYPPLSKKQPCLLKKDKANTNKYKKKSLLSIDHHTTE